MASSCSHHHRTAAAAAAAVLAGVALLAPGAQSLIPGVKTRATDSSWRDDANRTRLWHGTNFVEKSASESFYPHELVGDAAAESVKTMNSLGFNVVRLGVMMGGTLPTPDGVVNATYLDVIEGIVDTLWAGGIASILDLHQDVLSPQVCGEGLPDWMVNSSTLGALPFPEPLVRGGSAPDPATGGWAPPVACTPVGPLKGMGWSEWYGTDAVGKAFQQIYDGVGPLSANVQAHWAAVARRFAGKAGVLAYEILNEPWQGDWVSDPSLIVRGQVAEQKNVGPFMQRTYDTIRRGGGDADTPVLYAPAELNNRLMRSVGFEAGFLPGEPMAFHVYCLTGTGGDGPTTPQQVELCHFNDGFTLAQRERDLQRLGTAGFVTEFGAVSDAPTGLDEVRFVAEAMDAAQPTPLSWAFWDKLPPDSEGDYRRALARAYPTAVAGDNVDFSFNASTAAFDLTYDAFGAGGVTEIYLGSWNYPGFAWDVTATPEGCCTVTDDQPSGPGKVFVEVVGGGAERQPVHVHAAPRE